LDITRICAENNILVRASWLPHSLNNVADIISRFLDDEDYGITEEFFLQICNDFKTVPVVDCFADSRNKKCEKFFSLNFCFGTAGVDAFLFDWNMWGICWLFPAPRLVVRTLQHLQNCNATGLLLVPQWKNSHFYPVLRRLAVRPYVQRKIVYNGNGGFVHGADRNSHFGPNFTGNVEVYHFKF